jgi:hypothetical protein
MTALLLVCIFGIVPLSAVAAVGADIPGVTDDNGSDEDDSDEGDSDEGGSDEGGSEEGGSDEGGSGEGGSGDGGPPALALGGVPEVNAEGEPEPNAAEGRFGILALPEPERDAAGEQYGGDGNRDCNDGKRDCHNEKADPGCSDGGRTCHNDDTVLTPDPQLGLYLRDDCAIFVKNFSNAVKMSACQTATKATLATGVNSQTACAGFSRQRRPGFKRSDYEACVMSIQLSYSAMGQIFTP